MSSTFDQALDFVSACGGVATVFAAQYLKGGGKIPEVTIDPNLLIGGLASMTVLFVDTLRSLGKTDEEISQIVVNDALSRELWITTLRNKQKEQQ